MPDPIVMVQVFAELRYGVVAHTRENSVKYGLNFNHKPLTLKAKKGYDPPASAIRVMDIGLAYMQASPDLAHGARVQIVYTD